MGDRRFFQRSCPAPVILAPCPVVVPAASCQGTVVVTPLQSNECGTVIVNPTPVTAGVTPSPITPSDPNLEGTAILSDLRTRALARCLGGEAFSSILPEIQRRLGDRSDSQFVELPHEVHSSASGIEGAFAGKTSHIRMANGVLGEFNQVVTFSVPASDGNLRLRGYYFDSPTRTTSGWNSDSNFTPGNTNSQRFHNLYEVHVRREGDRFVYTVALTHGFVGGLRIDSGSGSMILHSHGARPAPPSSDSRSLVAAPQTEAETPAETPVHSALAPPPLPDSSPPPGGVLTSGVLANQNSALPPRNSTAHNPTISGGSPGVGDTVVANTPTGGIPSPALPDETATDVMPPLRSTVSGGSAPLPATGTGGTAVAGANPPTSSSDSGGTVASLLPPPTLESDTPSGSSTLGSGTLAAPPPVLTNSDGLFSGLVRRISGSVPALASLAGGQDSAAPLSPPILDAPAGGSSSSLVSGGSASGGSTPTTGTLNSPGGSRPTVNGTTVVAAVPRYLAPQFPLPPYMPPTVEISEDTRLRALALSVLGQFTVRPMHDMTSGVRLPENNAGRHLFEEVVDACYYLPETAFGYLSRFTNPQRAEDRSPLDSLDTLSSALLGTGRDTPPRGSSLSVDTRTNDISSYLEANPRLAAGPQAELREIRHRLLSMSGPLRWAARYVDQRQMDQAQAAGEEPGTLLDPSIRPTSHHPLTVALQGTFRRAFGPQQIPSTYTWTQAMTAIQSLDGNRLESASEFSTQDFLAIRNLILVAREARRDPAFLAQFAASRQTQVQTQLLPLLAPGTGGTVAEAPVLQYFQNTFGATATNQNRAEILRLVRGLNENNTPARRGEVAAQLLQPFAGQMTFGDVQLRELDTALDRLEAYNNRIRLLLRAQSVADGTDEAIGAFLTLLPDTPGTPARANPSQEDFQTRLTRALTAIEGEYALLSGDQVGGTYASTRREILKIYLKDLKEHLLRDGSEWGAFLQDTRVQRALRARLDRATPATGTATELPADPIALIEGFSELMQLGLRRVATQDSLNLMMRIIQGRGSPTP